MLTQLNSDKYEVIRNLFPKYYPNLAFIYAVIEKKIKGEVWVDNINNPQAALVVYGFYIFISGKITKKIFDEFYFIIREKIKFLEKMSSNVKASLSLVCPQEMMESPVNFEEFGFVSVPRIEYEYKNNSSPSEYKNNSEYDSISIDKDNVSHCLWYRFIGNIYEGDNAGHHLGYMLWDKQSRCVVSEAHGVVGGDLVEIGTTTNPSYEKKGFATNICARLIVEAGKKGLRPIWSCNRDNIPSNKTAKRLGMEVRQEYLFHNIGKK